MKLGTQFLVFSLIGLRYFVEAGLTAELGQLLAIGGSLVVNFAGNRLWVFSVVV